MNSFKGPHLSLRTENLVGGFRKELTERLANIKTVRAELERLYALRVEDGKIDLPENASYKEEAMVAIRNAEAAFTSYAGSIRSIKGVIESSPKNMQKLCLLDTHIYICHIYIYWNISNSFAPEVAHAAKEPPKVKSKAKGKAQPSSPETEGVQQQT